MSIDSTPLFTFLQLNQVINVKVTLVMLTKKKKTDACSYNSEGNVFLCVSVHSISC